MRRITIFTIGAIIAVPFMPLHADDSDDAKMKQQCPALAAWIKARLPHQTTKQRDAHRTFAQPALRQELLRMEAEDQKTRAAVVASGEKDAALNKAVWTADGKHLQRLKKIDKAYGFPTEMQVGAEGVDAAWILTQHADRDRPFQAHVLSELKSRSANGGVGAQDFALLTDRVLVGQNKPQRYGTQFTVVNGALKASPIEDAAKVDKRRTAIGLPSMVDYECLLRMEYQPLLKQ